VLVVLYYSLLAVVLTAAIILFNGIRESTNLFVYDQDQLLATLPPAIFYTGAVYSLTVAMQNERPGFVILLGYMGLVYTHVGHSVMNYSTFCGQELLGISIILTMNVTLVFKGLSQTA